MSERKSSIADTQITSRKASAGDQEMFSSEEDELPEVGTQKYITPIEVRDHLKKLWKKEESLLGLIYGRFDAEKPFHTDTLGYEQFFLEKVVVPPSRFRPESEGGLGGTGQAGKAYLHTHSAMLMKILQQNIQLSDALVEM